MVKILHIIVRHRARPHPNYPNQWLDDDRIRSIVTYKEIADLCASLVASASAVRIHRTGSYEESPVVCCEAIVQAVRPQGTLFQVEFTNVRTLCLPPPIRPDGKRSWYFADVEDATPHDVVHPAVTATAIPGQAESPKTEPAVPPSSNLAQTADPVPGPSAQAEVRSQAIPSSPTTTNPASGSSGDHESRPHSKHLELLRRGIEDWNFARMSKPDVKPNLEGADLREALGKAGRLASVQLVGADMRGASLAGLAFYQPVLVDASLVGADLTGASWQGAHRPEPILLGILESMHLNLRAANLERADLSRTRFEKPCLRGVTFRLAKLVDADFSGSTLEGICFDGADLRRANLRGADLTNASFDGADLRGADLSTATISERQIARALTDSETKLPVDWKF